MPFPSGLTSQQYTDIRSNGYSRKAYVLRTPKSIVFQATVEDAVNGADYAIIAYDTPTTGAYTDIVSGMTVLVHTDSSDIDDVLFPATYARGSANDLTVNIGWQSTNLLGTDTITVLNDYRLHVRQVRASSNIIYIDYDQTFTELPPCIRGLQSVYAVNSSSASSIDFAPTVEAMASGAAISTYLWDVGDGTISTGTSASKDITVSFPAWTSGETSGWRWVSLTATDDNGNSSVFHFQVFVGDFNSATWVMDDVLGVEVGSVLDNGMVASLTVGSESPALLYENNHITIVVDENKNTDTDPIVSNILFTGRLAGLVDNVTAQLIAETYQIQMGYSTSYELQGYGNELEFLPLPEYQLLNDATPTGWNDVEDLSIPRAIWYVLTRLTTAPLFMSFDLDIATYNTYENSGFSFESGATLESINYVASYIGCQLMFSRSGECVLAKDARLMSDADRSGLDTLIALTSDDLLESIEITKPPRARIGRIVATGALYNTSADDTALGQIQAPKIPNTVGESVRNVEFLAESDQDTDDFEAELAIITANTLAIKNTSTKITTNILDGYWWLLAYNSAWATLTFSDFQSGLAFTSSIRFVVDSVTLSIQTQLEENGRIDQRWTNTITLAEETSDEGIANSFKLAPKVLPYDVPSNPLIPEYGSDWDSDNSYEDGSQGLTDDTGAGDSPQTVQPPDAEEPDSPTTDSISVPFVGTKVTMNKTTIASNVYKATVTGLGVIGDAGIVDFDGGYAYSILLGYYTVDDQMSNGTGIGRDNKGISAGDARVTIEVILGTPTNITGVNFDMLTNNAAPVQYTPKYNVAYYDIDGVLIWTSGDTAAGVSKFTWSAISVSHSESSVYSVRVSAIEVQTTNSVEARIDNIDIGGFTGASIYADGFYRITGAALGAADGLQLNNANIPTSSTNPSSYNPAHQYVFYFTGAGQKEEFYFADSDSYADNSGSLSVKIEGVFA